MNIIVPVAIFNWEDNASSFEVVTQSLQILHSSSNNILTRRHLGKAIKYHVYNHPCC